MGRFAEGIFGMLKSAGICSRNAGFVKVLRLVFVLAALMPLASPVLASDGDGKVAVLPFRVYADASLQHLQTGLQSMIRERIAVRGLEVLGTDAVNRHPGVFDMPLSAEALARAGMQLGVRYVVAGSLTQIGERISIDAKILDTAKPDAPALIYMVADNVNAVPDTTDGLAKSIYNQITGAVQVDSLVVRGNQRVESAAVLANVATRKGSTLDYAELDKDLRNIYKMGFFTDVKIETEDGPNGKIVVFVVTEKPSIGKIVFEGNKKVNSEDLTKEIGIRAFSILDETAIKQSINRLAEFYRKKGYYNIALDYRIESLPGNQVQLTYLVDEKEKVYIKKIAFTGNTYYKDGDLKDLMETSEKGWFSWVTDSGVLDEKKLEFDTHKLTASYHNQGFIKARVGQPRIAYDEKLEGLQVTIDIFEGERYKVNEVGVEGEMIRPEEELLNRVAIGKEPYFNREVVRKDILSLVDVYNDEGFAYAEVTPLTAENDAEHLVNVTYRITKGPKVRFERIDISGNTITRDKVIRRELEVVEGEVFSGRNLKRSNENLNRLGYFENVEVKTEKGTEEDQMVLDIKVKERPTGSFSFGGGYSSVDSAFVAFQIAQENFMGYGQKLSASVRLGGISTEFDVRFVEPWFLDKPLSLGVDAYKWDREWDEYDKDSLGGNVSLGFPVKLDSYTRGFVQYTYDDANITDVAEDAAFIIKDMEGRNLTSSLTLGLKRDSRDKPWDTSRGSVNSLSVEWAGPPLGGDVAFTKYVARSAWYFPMPWSTVLLLQGRWGYIQDRPSDGKLPVYQKFFLGGINTIRGFDYGDVSPWDPVTWDRIGGEREMVYNVEYRFPLIKEQGVVGLVFFDAGNVWTDYEPSENVSGLRTSAGVGVRWYSPMGPLRLEYGKNLDPQRDEESGKWEFSVGGLF
ncbi:outer membrane protein assembly factor BamA [Desulfatiglans anilini]|uniref:outer membrane protein assembly factor BamA n=1 Tax=Desulfatiglans anilini TaxID=90728 RepID=UPI000423C233|nr:outer membrane protein assembly factor BamA [Desulfatiglans anilini]